MFSHYSMHTIGEKSSFVLNTDIYNIYVLDINGVLSVTQFEILITRLCTTTIHNDAMFIKYAQNTLRNYGTQQLFFLFQW